MSRRHSKLSTALRSIAIPSKSSTVASTSMSCTSLKPSLPRRSSFLAALDTVQAKFPGIALPSSQPTLRDAQVSSSRRRQQSLETAFDARLSYIALQSYFTRPVKSSIGQNASGLVQSRAAAPNWSSYSLAHMTPTLGTIAHQARAFHVSRAARADEHDRSNPNKDKTLSASQPPASQQSTQTDAESTKNLRPENKSRLGKPDSTSTELTTTEKAYHHFANYPRSLRRLAMRAVPASAEQSQNRPASSNEVQTHEHHRLRPSKEDLLRIAQGFWTRLRIRFKWFTIRGFRRFNADDISAFFTLGGFTTAVFIIVGTTTFFSLIFAALNVLNLQEWIARKIADHLTAETGVTVVFESAIVPKWKESKISFKNVFISRRAHGDVDSLLKERRQKAQNGGADRPNKVKRRTAVTAGDGMAWEGTHYEEVEEVAPPMSDEARGEDLTEDDTVNTNYTMFDLQVDTIDVTLSLQRWFDGKGLIEDAEIRGVRGIVDRRNVFWDPDKPYDPRAARRGSRHGDFELESLKIEDFLVTVYQPNDFRPFNFSIFSAHIPKLRKQWLFYDLLSADSITGQVDGCLLSLHKPQSISRTVEQDREMIHSKWKTMSRMRVDGVNFDHIQNQSDLTGPISWILSGKFDVVADIKFPRDLDDEADINTIINEVLDNLTAALSGDSNRGGEDDPIPGQHRLSGPAIEAPVSAVGATAERVRKESEEARRQGRDPPASRAGAAAQEKQGSGANAARESTYDEGSHPAAKPSLPPPTVVIDMDVRFKDIKAAVPLFTSDISYSTNAFVRPIVAFMNANKTLIPIRCRIVMDLSEFDGSLDLAQTGLLPVVSEKIYEALANHVASQNASSKRLKNVSLWSLQVSANAALNLVTLLRDTLARTTGTSAAVTTKGSG
ncbi:related to MDM31 - Mitochondrial inner membrane protein required for mitochondrial morphology and inheritance [Melanopsichium pennsylvanicum]|uniref:Related to MDM31 - Mitochondrial inner membrane protein required for mitochondrial morphology and inheritance n=2 Tax=Melanopsichium pennsylvanicum TaxID=63383 RepID=A0AAJ4XHW8_9BASI|nr:related to MDM31-Mitochondrial inner membrane protein required for mitochondrial morphology and inheritance [Melanopsichium pennsylvanicum 4]SNX82642.1 related to MDM31 - Mitochondrial inner membrane protein required for mitochondrial morphology and inheritance [Melanopsichium pennsylvanicum]